MPMSRVAQLWIKFRVYVCIINTVTDIEAVLQSGIQSNFVEYQQYLRETEIFSGTDENDQSLACGPCYVLSL